MPDPIRWPSRPVVWFGLLLSGILLGTQGAAAESAKPTCAIVELGPSPVATLVEAKLLEIDSRDWLDRGEVQRLLKEQELQALLGPTAGPGRVKLGQILKAKVLVFLRSGERDKVKFLEAIVAETERGLRLLSRTLPLSAKPEEDAAEIVRLVDRAIERLNEPVDVCAVPPFLSQDLTFEHDHLKAAYAKLIEEALLDRPGMLVVELAEAEAIAREARLAGNEVAIKRQLPLYVLGEYRTRKNDSRLEIGLRVRLQRGEQTLETFRHVGELAKTAEFLLDIAGKTAGRDVKIAVVDPATEARQLAQRAESFARLGNWAEAASLGEASLLLRPDDPAVLREVITALVRKGTKPPDFGSLALISSTWHTRRRALQHLERLLQHEAAFAAFAREERLTFMDALLTPEKTPLNSAYPESLQEVAALAQTEERAIANKLAHWFARQGNWQASAWFLMRAVRNSPPRERYAERRKLVLEYQNAPGGVAAANLISLSGAVVDRLDTAEGREYLAALESDPAARPEIRGVAQSLVQQLNQAVAKANASPAAASPANDAAPLGPTRVRFVKQDVRIEGGLKLEHVLRWFAGDGCDLVVKWPWVGVMRDKGLVKPIWNAQMTGLNLGGFTDAAYDGRFVWVIAAGPGFEPNLLIVDPLSGTWRQIAREQGLPTWEATSETATRPVRTLMVAPLSPGEVCVAGGFGRGWIGVARYHDGRPSVEVLHEAKEAHNRDDKEQWKRATAAFHPSYMAVVADADSPGQPAERRVIIGRNDVGLNANPLIVDVDRRSVNVAPEYWWSTVEGDAWHGAHYQVLPEVSANRLDLFRITPRELPRKRLATNVREGQVICADNRLHVLGKHWWTAKLDDGAAIELTNAGRVPWYHHNRWGASGPDNSRQSADDYRLRFVARSHHYGLVAYYQCDSLKSHKLAQVVFDEANDDASHRADEPSVARAEQPVAIRRAANGTETAGLWRFAPPGTRFVTFSVDGTTVFTSPPVKQWNAVDGKFLAAMEVAGSTVKSLRLGPRHAALAVEDGRILLQPLDEEGRSVTLRQSVRAMGFSPDGNWLATSSSDGVLRLWEVNSGVARHEFRLPHNGYDRVTFSVDGRQVGVSGRHGSELYDVAAGRLVQRTETLAELFVFQPDGTIVGRFADATGALVGWRPETRSVRTLVARPGGEVLAVSPDGRWAAVLEYWKLVADRIEPSSRLVIWNLTTGAEFRPEGGPLENALAATFSPDSTQLVIVFRTGQLHRHSLPGSSP